MQTHIKEETTMAELWQMSGLALGQAIAAKEVSATDGLGIFGPDHVAGERVACPLEPFFTYPFNMSGQPAASIPAGFTRDGLPVGLQIIGRRYDEATVLRASARFEEARPWADRWPEL
jgi:Asp-tRNA(Asn)/Glu-tRNA(Gln) amidotransferase A subunit family amidase